MTFKKSYVPGILGSVLTLTVIMAAPVKAETKEETILNKTDWSTMAAANVEGYVNIRSEANADSEIVGVLMPGYAVTDFGMRGMSCMDEAQRRVEQDLFQWCRRLHKE